MRAKVFGIAILCLSLGACTPTDKATPVVPSFTALAQQVIAATRKGCSYEPQIDSAIALLKLINFIVPDKVIKAKELICEAFGKSDKAGPLIIVVKQPNGEQKRVFIRGKLVP